MVEREVEGEGGFKLIGVPHLRFFVLFFFFFLSLTFCKPLTEPPHAPNQRWGGCEDICVVVNVNLSGETEGRRI